MAIQEAKHNFADQAFPSTQKAAKWPLSDVSFGRFKKAPTGFKNTQFCLVEGVLKVMATKGSLDETSKSDLEN